MLRVSQLAALFIASMVASAGHGADYFGAIAYSAQTRQYGWANNHPSRDSAEQAALPVCRKGGADWGESKAPAEKKALAACARRSGKCTLTRSFCTGT